MPRLFAALELPPDIAARLALIRGELQGARWMSPEDMHITLRFAGDISAEQAREWARSLDDVAVDPFTVRIRGAGHFGGRETNAVWAGVAADQGMEVLRRAIERAGRHAGLPPEARGFKPHVTLARMRGAPASAVARFLEDHGALDFAPFAVARFVLMSARDGRGGGPYAVEEAYELGLFSHLGESEIDPSR